MCSHSAISSAFPCFPEDLTILQQNKHLHLHLSHTCALRSYCNFFAQVSSNIASQQDRKFQEGRVKQEDRLLFTSERKRCSKPGVSVCKLRKDGLLRGDECNRDTRARRRASCSRIHCKAACTEKNRSSARDRRGEGRHRNDNSHGFLRLCGIALITTIHYSSERRPHLRFTPRPYPTRKTPISVPGLSHLLREWAKSLPDFVRHFDTLRPIKPWITHACVVFLESFRGNLVHGAS